ncbi:MAG: MauE/DoxX family redox-associated membrane protein [Verrucomicrobiota bacterium]
MTAFLKSPLFLTFLRWLCAALFGIAAWGKLRDPLAFADSIAAYDLMRWKPGITLLALILPVFEILLAVLLITGWWRRAAVLGTAGLTLIFTVALLSAAARGLKIDCGCFSGLSDMPVHWAIVRNLLLIGILAWILAADKPEQMKG